MGEEILQRANISWKDPEFLQEPQLEAQLRETFEICNTCRKCTSLCDSFPRLFRLVDSAQEKDVKSISPRRFSDVIDACTLCDMCYPICPYIAPHEYQVDFPSMVVRYRAVQRRKGVRNFQQEQLGKTDRNGRFFCHWSRFVNWVTNKENIFSRLVMQWVAGIDRSAVLPRFQSQRFSQLSEIKQKGINPDAPGAGRKVVIYATCFVEYNNADIGRSAKRVLEKNGIEVEVAYSACCGMPQLEGGNLEAVSSKAGSISYELAQWVDRGYDIVTLIPSCSLMLKSTWPMYLPDNDDVRKVALNTYDICEYMVELLRTDGIAEGLQTINGDIVLHHACHAQAQNLGPKSAVILRLIPGSRVTVTQQCSGHGGTWGVLARNHHVAVELASPLVDRIISEDCRYFSSECPLAGNHISEGIAQTRKQDASNSYRFFHPIELLAKSYGVEIS